MSTFYSRSSISLNLRVRDQWRHCRCTSQTRYLPRPRAYLLTFAAATFGGITRDVLIGALPPASIQDWKYVAVSVVAGITTFFWYAKVSRVQHTVLIFDAAGLGLFAVTGAGKALAYHLGPIPAALLSMLTGIGGGVVRDVLVSEVPAVFRTDIYAVAALARASSSLEAYCRCRHSRQLSAERSFALGFES